MKKIKFSKEEIQAFKLYFDKGPVDRESSQRCANNAKNKIKMYLTYFEISSLETARDHSLNCSEGREEWDQISNQIKKRLGI